MKKFISFIIPIVTLTSFLIIMLGGNYFKRPHNSSEDVIAFINISIKDARVENWDKLNEDVTKIDYAWEKIIPRIQFSVETDEILDINLDIARLKGSIESKDKNSTIIELNEIVENWNDLIT